MPRTPAPAAPPPDLLADLRPPEQAGAVETVTPEPETEPTHALAWHRERQARIIATWHADRTAQGLLHRGQVCGCQALARQALQAVHGAPVEAAPEPDEHQEP